MPVSDPYDDLPYTDHAYGESHPNRLSAVALLTGWQPPALERARILELGCARGGNLLPMAMSMPQATFLGVDRAARQIDEATTIARSAPVDNAGFVASAVETFEPPGVFDFVVCHGLCSWVPPATRRALLATIATALAPGGIAYVSVNTLPGWYGRLAARDWLRTMPSQEPIASLSWLRDAISPERADYRKQIDAVVSRLRGTDPAYARHEYLADEHHPQLVRDLLAEGSDAGLAYLGDAIPSETAVELLPQAVAARVCELDVATGQQLIDFVRCTAFRRALFVRASDARDRAWSRPCHLDPHALRALRVTSRLRPHAPPNPDATSERFDGPDGLGIVSSGALVRRALHELSHAAPRSIAFSDLQTAAPGSADELRAELLDLWLATGGLDLHVREPVLGDGTTHRPRCCALARWHAMREGTLTNRWHQEVRLDDPVLRDILVRLDGSRTLSDVARELGATGPTASLGFDDRLRLTQAGVQALASLALLVG